MLARGRRPVLLGGAFAAALEWDLGRTWPRFVLPPGEPVAGFDLRFVAGVDVLVIHRPDHNAQHVRDCVEALRAHQAHLVVAIALPPVDQLAR
jgi:hypothetical protein